VTYAGGGADSVGSIHSAPGGRAPSVDTAELAHEEVCAELSDLLSGELDEAQQARVLDHLSHCAACAATHATLRATVDLLRTQPAHRAPLPLRQRLLNIPDQPDP
jgi:anti-sigma factor RsiW